MKTIYKEVAMVWESIANEEYPKIYRFRLTDSETCEHQVFKITGITGKERTRIDRKEYLRYLCKVASNGMSRPCEILYNLETTTWILYKI